MAAHPKTILLSGMVSHDALAFPKVELAVSILRSGQCQPRVALPPHHQFFGTEYDIPTA
jgi:hypothetical protein